MKSAGSKVNLKKNSLKVFLHDGSVKHLTSQTLGGGGYELDLRGGNAMVVPFCKTFRQL